MRVVKVPDGASWGTGNVVQLDLGLDGPDVFIPGKNPCTVPYDYGVFPFLNNIAWESFHIRQTEPCRFKG